MMVLGVDPHKNSHTVVALEAATGEVRGELTVVADQRGHERLLAWARSLGPERTGPGEEPFVAALVGHHGELAAHLAGGGLEGDDGVAVLVRVDAEYHHELSPFGRILRSAGPSADTPQWGPLARLLSGHAGEPRGRRRGTQRMLVSPVGRQQPNGSPRRHAAGYPTTSGIPTGLA